MNILKVGRKDFIEDQDLFNISWFVTKKCNYKCIYCGIKKDEDFLKLEKCNKIIDYINSIEESGRKVILTLTGGESLLHPNIIDIVKRIKTTRLRIKTNSSHGYDIFSNFMDSVQPEIHIDAEYHYPFIWPKDYLETLEYITPRIHFVSSKVFWDIRNKDYTLDVYKEAKKLEEKYSNLKVYLDIPRHPFFAWDKEDLDFIESLTISKDFLIFYEEDGKQKQQEVSYPEAIKMCRENIENYKGFICNSSKDSLTIDSNGDVFRCNELFYIKSPMFNIFKEPLFSENEEGECPIESFCYDLTISKRKQ
jgi:MoaA/NifB/PqqE/SkfB family radical SAM enzyme